MMLWWLIGAALAQEPTELPDKTAPAVENLTPGQAVPPSLPIADTVIPPLPPEEPLPDVPPVEPRVASDDPYEIIVYGESQLRSAREQVIRAMSEAGWRERHRRSDGKIVFKGPGGWTGKALFDPDGYLVFKSPGVVVTADNEQTGVQGTDSVLNRTVAPQPGASIRMMIPSKRKITPRREALLTAVHPQMIAYDEVLQGTRFDDALTRLPARLDELWTQGTGLGGGTLDTTEARRTAILEFWASRTDSPEGEQVQQAIEAWWSATITAPLTDVEREAAEKKAKKPFPVR